jgi:hypothetical protein
VADSSLVEAQKRNVFGSRANRLGQFLPHVNCAGFRAFSSPILGQWWKWRVLCCSDSVAMSLHHSTDGARFYLDEREAQLEWFAAAAMEAAVQRRPQYLAVIIKRIDGTR